MQAQRLSPDSSRNDLQSLTGAGCCGLRLFTQHTPLWSSPLFPQKRAYAQSYSCKKISSSLQVFKFLPQHLLTHPNVHLCSSEVSGEVEQHTIVLRRMVHYCWAQFASENNQRTFMGVITTGSAESGVKALQQRQNHHFHSSPREKTLKNI